MTSYLARRLLGAVQLLLFICLFSYALMGLAPGGPDAIYSSPRITPAARAQLHAELGLDRPWYVQFFFWIATLLHGSLGVSYVDRQPVLQKIFEKLPITIELIGLSLLVTLAVALPLGVLAGTRRGSWLDHAITTVGFVTYGIPVFWLAIVLIDLFAVHLHWVPSSGISSLGRENDPIDRLRHLVLPVASLSVVSFAGWMRFQRGAVIETLDAPYIRTARGKGLAERVVMWRHSLRNALLPIITLLGLTLPGLVGGAYFVEYVFSLPGLGYLGVTSVFSRDYPVVMGTTLLSAVFVVLGNLLADLCYAVADPRIRYD